MLKRKREALFMSRRSQGHSRETRKTRQTGNGRDKANPFPTLKMSRRSGFVHLRRAATSPNSGSLLAFPSYPAWLPFPFGRAIFALSLVLVPVRLFATPTSTEGTIAFGMIHQPSGKPIRYVKGIETDEGFKKVPGKKSSKATSTAKATTPSSSPRNSTS